MKKIIVFLVSVGALALGLISAFNLAERAKQELGKESYEYLPDETVTPAITHSHFPASQISSANKEQSSGMEELIINPVIGNNHQYHINHSLQRVKYNTNSKVSPLNVQFGNAKEKNKAADISSGGMMLAYGKASQQSEGNSGGSGHNISSAFNVPLSTQLSTNAALQEYIDPDNTYWETPPKTLPIPNCLLCFFVFILVFIGYKKFCR